MNQLVETDKAEIMSAVDTVGDKGKHVSVNAHNKFTEFSNFLCLSPSQFLSNRHGSLKAFNQRTMSRMAPILKHFFKMWYLYFKNVQCGTCTISLFAILVLGVNTLTLVDATCQAPIS